MSVHAIRVRLQKARENLDGAMDEARRAALTLIDQGVTEVDVAKTLGVNRMTVRRWLGKL